MVISNFFSLAYPASSGIIALLSVTNTKRSTLQVAFNRFFSLSLATCISIICFYTIGFNPFAFSIYLLLFIPLSVRFKLSDGISVSSVLVSQYLIEKNTSISLIFNAFFLLFIGVGCALLINLYMPNTTRQLLETQQDIEQLMKSIMLGLENKLKNLIDQESFTEQFEQIKELLLQGESLAVRQSENYFFQQNIYYLQYFEIRKAQSKILYEMSEVIENIVVTQEQSQAIQTLFHYTVETLAEDNDGEEILKKIQETYEYYRKQELPKSREEFEGRALLFQLLIDFKRFIEIKNDFVLAFRKFEE